MKKKSINKNVYYVLGILFIIVLWEIVSLFLDDNNLIFPSFFDVIKNLLLILKTSYLYKCLLSTFVRMLIGLFFAGIFSLLIGSISGNNDSFRYFISPIITCFKSIPTASLVFLFLVYVGAKNTPIYIVFLISFPIIYESVTDSYLNIDNNINDVLDLEKGSFFKKIISIRLPLAINGFKLGLLSSFSLAFKIEIMAEVISGSTTYGLGSAINYIQKADPTNMVGVLAYSLVAIVLSLFIDFLYKLLVKNS